MANPADPSAPGLEGLTSGPCPSPFPSQGPFRTWLRHLASSWGGTERWRIVIVHELCLDRSGPSASAYKLEFSAHDCSWSGLSVGKMLYVQLRVFGPFLDIPDVLAEVRRWMLVLSPAPAPARGGGERRQQRRQPEELEFFVMYSRPVPAAFCGALVRAHECKTRDACFECGPCRASMEALVGQSKRHFRAAKAMEGIDEHLYTLKLIDSLGEGPLTIDAFEETPSSVEG